MQNFRWRNLESENGLCREFCHDALFHWLEMRIDAFPSRKAKVGIGQIPYLFLRLRHFPQKTDSFHNQLLTARNHCDTD